LKSMITANIQFCVGAAVEPEKTVVTWV